MQNYFKKLLQQKYIQHILMKVDRIFTFRKKLFRMTTLQNNNKSLTLWLFIKVIVSVMIKTRAVTRIYTQYIYITRTNMKKYLNMN